MDLGLQDKVVFITGSSRGIGFATASAFLEEGAKVIINGRDEDALMTAFMKLEEKNHDRVKYVAGDILSDEWAGDIYDKVLNCFGGLDSLVANLGNGRANSNIYLDTEEFRRFYDVNVLGNINTLSKLHPLLRKSKEASVIFVSSIVAKAYANAPIGYAASKSALLTVSKYLSDQWARDGIRVNCVLPGNIYFEGGRWEELRNQNPDEVDEYIRSNVPMARFGSPKEIADAIVFLSSEKAGFITGASLVVDGGQLNII